MIYPYMLILFVKVRVIKRRLKFPVSRSVDVLYIFLLRLQIYIKYLELQFFFPIFFRKIQKNILIVIFCVYIYDFKARILPVSIG